MRYSQLFGKTLKEAPKDAVLPSHRLLYQAGYIRESTAGRYFFLPLGWRVHEKIKRIIKEEMDRAGAQELIAPVMHPKSLWEETNRTTSVGFELMSIKDRSEAEFVLGGTAEEMLVDVVRKFQISYKDLPFNLYQFSTKFRDEKRARGGLLRAREFVMKDAYSFHATPEDFEREYTSMKEVYTRIFTRLGLNTVIVESDNGYIGGEYCHEFIVVSDAGESRFFMTEDGSYAAHEDVARFQRDEKNTSDALLSMEEVDAQRGPTMEDGVVLHGLPLWQQMKDVMCVDEKGRMILAVIRGDYEVNEVKLAHAVGAYTLQHATEDEIRRIGSVPGFISPVGLKSKAAESGVELVVVGDISLRTVHNMYTGANALHRDLLHVNIDRDYTVDIETDIALAREGDIAENGKMLVAMKGIEVGNIFQLGYHYSSRMDSAHFTADDGTKKPYYMGCYGIGIGRTMQTIVEMSHDTKGMLWPERVAPYQVHLIGLEREKAEDVYRRLQEAGVEVLYDDRDVSAGEKFADYDLIGIPLRLVVSAKTGDKIEMKKRNKEDTSLVTYEELLSHINR
jgi:prolyl-tRNA synthetase